MNPDDDEAERKLKDKLEEVHADRVETSLHGWQRELIPPGSTAQTLAPLATGPVEMPQRARDALSRMLIDSTDLGTTVAFAQLDSLGLSMDYTLVNLAARNRAITYGSELVRGIEDTTRRAVNETVGRWIENGEPLSRLTAELAPTFGRARAEAIASTEVTRAYYDGNVTAWRESGLVEKQEWRTAMDERVCPTCGPLNNVQVLIGETWPGGLTPPAHVRCRCWAVPVVEAAVEPEAADTPQATPEPKVTRPDRLHQSVMDLKAEQDAQLEVIRARYQPLVDELEQDRANLAAYLKTYPPKTDPKFAAWERERDRLANALKVKESKLANRVTNEGIVRSEYAEKARATLAAEQPSKMDIGFYQEKPIPGMEQSVQQGQQAFESLVDQRVLNKVNEDRLYVEITSSKTPRSYYQDQKIVMGRRDPATVVHELGHWLEDSVPGMNEKLIKAWQSRTAGEKTAWLGHGLDKDEVGRLDKFLTFYMGKVYMRGSKVMSTEMMSVGMENLYRDPIHFATQDPDTFKFILSLIQGTK